MSNCYLSFSARNFVPWAILVGWSRVAKGRHFLLDVLCGGLLGKYKISVNAMTIQFSIFVSTGSMLGFFVEDVATSYERSVIKTFCGIYTVIMHFSCRQ